VRAKRWPAASRAISSMAATPELLSSAPEKKAS
jgi:hypothetical protein